MSAVTAGLCIAAALVLPPRCAPLVLAAWFADLLRPRCAEARASSRRPQASAAIATLVFVAALHTFVVDGDRAYAWLEKHVPIEREELARLTGWWCGGAVGAPCS